MVCDGVSGIDHRGRRSLTASINLPFTLFTSRLLSMHVGCLLATGFLGQKHLCVTTMFVYIPQTPPPRSK